MSERAEREKSLRPALELGLEKRLRWTGNDCNSVGSARMASRYGGAAKSAGALKLKFFSWAILKA